MKDHLQKTVDTNDPEFVSVIDELSLWAAPFGLRLLETITMRRNIQVLDIGPGLGFPLIEIAERLGSSSMVYGIDPWERAVERARLKANVHKLRTVEVLVGEAEHLPFEKERFDLVVSNNGINNVRDMDQVFRECRRVCKWFLGAWKEFLPPDDCEAILDQMESTLNAQAQTEGEVVLTIPFATIDCRRR